MQVVRSPAEAIIGGFRFYSENGLEGFEWKTDKVNLCFIRSFWLPCGRYIEGDQAWEQEESEEAITVVQVAGSLDGWPYGWKEVD